MDKSLDHDFECWVRLFEDRYALVLAVARRYAPSPDLAYDIVQQTFVHFVEASRKNRWDPEHDVGPLLFEIAKNIATDLWRDRQRQSRLAVRMFEQKLLDPLDGDRLGDEMELHEAKTKALKHCLEKMPQKSRQLIGRHYTENVPIENIAKEQKTSGNTMRQIFCRLRAKLRNCIRQAIHERTDQ